MQHQSPVSRQLADVIDEFAQQIRAWAGHVVTATETCTILKTIDHGIGHITDINRLQSRPCPGQRKNRKEFEQGRKGIEECRFVLQTLNNLGLNNSIEFDLTLARGLNYYTGCIFEVKALDVEIGSITGGGRYDNLTGIFGMPGLSGVGISFGADRIFDVLNQLNLYPKEVIAGTQLLFINFGPVEASHCVSLALQARQAGIRTEVYPDSAKMKKQMSYANAQQVPFVALIGENEIHNGNVSLKDMQTGEQKSLTMEQVIETVKSK